MSKRNWLPILILVTGEGAPALCLMTSGQVKTCQKLLKKYQDDHEWPEMVNTIILKTKIEPGKLVSMSLLSKDTISTEGLRQPPETPQEAVSGGLTPLRSSG